jgi:hypothetical protein
MGMGSHLEADICDRSPAYHTIVGMSSIERGRSLQTYSWNIELNK